jgi:hypothetical protein
LLDEHGEEVEFDLQRYHQVELSDLWTGDLSWRRLGVLVKHLPAESATKTALRNAAPVEELKERSRRRPTTGRGRRPTCCWPS